jgi:hypothetical protein
MKLKPIERGMIIHCKTENEAKELIKWAYECGYWWFTYSGCTMKDTCYKKYGEDTCYSFGHYERWVIYHCNTEFYMGRGGRIIEFADLIIGGNENEC